MNDWKKVKSNEVIQTELPQNIAMSATTFLTMALATERYLAVCRPILYRSLGTTILAKFFFLTISMQNNQIKCWQDWMHIVTRSDTQLQGAGDHLPPALPPGFPPAQHS